MTEIGKVNQLKILKSAPQGLYLDGGELGEILLPARYADSSWNPGHTIEVFITLDSEDRLVATTERPVAMVGEFACLRVVSATRIGAFLDWGLPKDLLVPFREQKTEMAEGCSYIVYIYLDRVSGRIVASSKLNKFLDQTPADYTVGDEVDLLINDRSDLGYSVIINNSHSGLLFHSDIFRPVKRGQRLPGFIREVRPDGKISVCFHKPGYEKVEDLTDTILNYLREQGGFMPVTDKNPPEEIYALFGVSKKTYKKAIGALYKKRLICFEENGTRLIS